MTRAGSILPKALTDALPADLAARRANWIEVARKDVADAARSWLLYTLCGLFMAVFLVAGIVTTLDPPEVDGSEVALDFGLGLGPLVWAIRWLVPLAALVVGYRSITGEREAGSLRVLLGLPITRRDVVVGKLLGRSIVFSTMLLVGLTLTGVELWYFYAGFDPLAYATFVGLTLFLGVVFVGAGIGFSALFRSRARAIGASLGTFASLFFVWPLLWMGVFYLLHGRAAREGDSAPLVVFFGHANPTVGFEGVVEEWVAELGVKSQEYVGTSSYADLIVEGTKPLYLQPAFVLAVMLLWALVPLVVGAWRFSRSDLG